MKAKGLLALIVMANESEKENSFPSLSEYVVYSDKIEYSLEEVENMISDAIRYYVNICK